ncbi:MAG: hypothetical protein CMC96_02705 [Flavobacteriales bacterium]|nr:hypothetical protein [Flavobacteriales bacterium]
MKKVYTLLIALLSLSFVPKVEASHNVGGEITWECLNDGRYVFKMKLYVDCFGAIWPFDIETLEVFGNPLPIDSNNQAIQSINLIPDSVRWMGTNFGDLSPDCNPNQFSSSLSCSDRSNGSIQVFYYKSAPIQLNGTPPNDGWHFRYELICCRPNSRNLVGGASGAILLRSIMYSDPAGINVQNCIDSSPEFVELPRVPFCLSYPIQYNQSAVDSDGDSLVYKWAKTYDIPAASPKERGFSSRFSFDNPTPDQSFNPLNKAAHIDNNTGIINLEVHDYRYSDWFVTVVEVAAYREGHKISSIFREVPYKFYDCLPIDSVTPNNQPEFYFDNIKQNEYEIVVEAGEKIEFPVQTTDIDSGVTGLPQEVTMFTSGNQFAADFMDTTNCSNPPCAVLKNNVPQYDSSRNRYQVSGANVVTTDFEWQTNCGHLNADGSQKSYYFYFSAKDDHCPVPQQVDTYVKVTVGAEGIKGAPKVECIEELSSNNQITWSAGQDLANSFNKWIIYAGNTPPLPIVDSIANFNVKTYVDNQKFAYYQVKASVNSTCVNQSVTLESPIRRSGYQRYPINVSILDTNRIIIAQDSAADSYQWYDCNTDTIITDSTRQSFAPQDSGYYAVIITKGYCSDTTDCVRIFPVGLNENRFQQTVRFYPNPTNGFVNIELPQKQQSIQVKVRNIHGQLVQEKKFVNQSNLQLQLKGKPGIYFIELVNEQGERANVKVVKR